MSDLNPVSLKHRASCDPCLASKVKCSQTKPVCLRCSQGRYRCVYGPLRRIGRPPRSSSASANAESGQQGASNKANVPKKQCTRQDTELGQESNLKPPSSAQDATVDLQTQNIGNGTSPHMADLTNPMDIDFDLPFWQYTNQSPQQTTASEAEPLSQTTNTVTDFSMFDFTTLEDDQFVDPAFLLAALANSSASSSRVEGNVSQSSSGPVSDCNTSLFNFPPGSSLSQLPQGQSISGSGSSASSSSASTLINDLSLNNPFPSPESLGRIDQSPCADRTSPPQTVKRTLECDGRRPAARSFPNKRFAIASRSSNAQHTDTRPTAIAQQMQCSNNCYSTLLEQLAILGDRAHDDHPVSLETLLGFDREVHREIDLTISCEPCRRKVNSRSPLHLAVMVLEHLLSLFEKTIEFDGACFHYFPERDFQESPAGKPRLTVGTVEVSEAVTGVYLRQLWLLHLQKLVKARKSLRKAASETLRAVSYEITVTMLADVQRRLFELRGVLASVGEVGSVF